MSRYVLKSGDDYEGAREREKSMRNAGARRKRWLTRNWRTSRGGNPYLNAENYNVVIYPAGRGWGFRVMNSVSSKAMLSRLPLPTPDAAKLRAFDAMIGMKQSHQ